MVTHIVFFKFKDRENIAKAREMLLNLKGKIPQLLHLEVGVDVLHTERSYDLALVSKFNSLEDLQAYQIHPLHVEVAEYLATVREAVAAVDYEVEA
ncbi:Dabb family protein [Desulforamulus ruminis]|uniref:Stress responsive alpha-beta barrel domain-containing protein n=1 Tax=Desulforamulus ruminis (strain ATCC 23193 / DSM 2154 / NCIMB 8452 / DL) TaxID=696281 RepID=F6DQK4_DESRL|nr:Dabb family protein [Desulforamulus ruminis]AEG60898.1 Stress responsive alpha-beta barrel domain-containing protein [Desulforamulus ruminis DSM 2154]